MMDAVPKTLPPVPSAPRRRWSTRARALVPLLGVAALATSVAVAVGASRPPVPLGGEAPPQLPRLQPEGGLSFDVRDAKTGGLIPCKLTLVGVDGTRDPELTHVDIARAESEGTIAAYNRVMSLTGSGVAHVPAGTYDVTVSRGPEWDTFTARHLKV